MKIGIPKEIHVGERRVAATPETVEQLAKLGYRVAIERGAGTNAAFTDDAYRQAGAEILPNARALWADSDIVLKVRAPEPDVRLGVHESQLLREGATLICFVLPAQNSELMNRLKARKATVLAMDCVPRMSRAQKLDALSSMANIAGYRAIVEAAQHFGRFFMGQITAAGKVAPAKVMVIGAGVAGLAAIGAARSLGAIVRAFDVRPEVRDQIKSLGAEVLDLDMKEDGAGSGGYAKQMSPEFIKAEMDLFGRQAMEVDIIVTTAQIPGKPAPKLITAGMIESMTDGGVIVDLAAEQGGNCDLTVPGEVVEYSGVTIIGYTDLPSRMPTQSSQLYATNVLHLLVELTPAKDGRVVIDMDDDVIRGATVVHEGAITWPPPPRVPLPQPAPVGPVAARAVLAKPVLPSAARAPKKSGPIKASSAALLLTLAAIALAAVGGAAPPAFMQHLTVFVLACFLGFHVIWNVTPALHTPLMSVTNAISGIIVIGALLQIGSASWLVKALAAVSVLIATINICGGFWVTHRMLKMFRRD
ncbi:MAG TPA: Re/Si-specific NAD(P)(+) transhydrogenase subunit alpha [Pseudomonadales bacterium]|nr:Re/Si-specific NAD(P)(+) transhydrogenase subunit alpha [Pseudomonadales bacterium]